MTKTTKIILAIILVAIIIGVGVAMNKSKDDTTSTPTNSNSSSSDHSNDGDTEAAVTITYDGDAFSASASTIKAGQSVRVINNSDKSLDFDSDPHPVHTDNKELNVGAIEPGGDATFTITKKGTWGYHNHLDSSQNGELTVE